MTNLMGQVLSAGFPLDPNNVIHMFKGGSNLHGAKVTGQDDLDIYGCYIDPPENILGIKTMEHFVTSTGQAINNTPEDVDVTMYSLHNWAKLMMKGNPAVLYYLYAPTDQYNFNRTWVDHIIPIREYMVTKKAAKQYLGFANSQRMRLTGEKGMGRHGQRQDLVDKYGFDTKFAMHYIRLLYECRELLTNRWLTLPRPTIERTHLIDIRQGEYTLDEVFISGKDLNTECESLLEQSELPDAPDINLLSDAVASAYQNHWMNNALR